MLDKKFKHDISIVVDRLVMKEGLRKRLAESIEAASQLADGLVEVEILDRQRPATRRRPRARAPRCCRARAPASAARCSSSARSSPASTAAPRCPSSSRGSSPSTRRTAAASAATGLGFQRVIDPELIVPDPTLSISEGALEPWTKAASIYHRRLLEAVAEANGIDTDVALARSARRRPRAAARGHRRRAPHDLLPQPLRPPAQVHGPLRGHAAQPPAPLREHRLRQHPRAGRGADGAAAVPGLRRRPAAPGEPRGHGRRAQRSTSTPQFSAQGGARVDRGAGADRDRARDRPPGRARDRRAAALPRLGRDRLPVAGARGDDALRRRGAADPARDPDRLQPGRRPLHPRRAVDRPAPARQREADRDARAPARPRQHGDRRRARRGHDPRRRPRRRPRARRRRARGRGRRRGHARRRSSASRAR